MKSEKENEKVNLDEMGVSIGVDSEVIEKVRSGEITHILIDINEDNQNMLLENIDGNLVLVTEELPDAFHGCYFYNGGEFPYAIKSVLEFLDLSSDDDHCLARIIDVDTEPGTRFNYQGAGKPIVEDPEGDSCVWEVAFEVVPVLMDARTYLMRWNPTIGSFTENDFEECMENCVHGMFRMDWSIYEWQEARRGDFFYMMRTGDDKAGIVFNGQFLSAPYPADDWAGSTKRRMYVDMVCYNAESGATPHISLEKLQAAIPAIDWSKGHSGELLSEEIATQLDDMRVLFSLILGAIYSIISFSIIRLKTRFCYANDICIKAGLFRDMAGLLDNNAGVMENTLGVLKITLGLLEKAFTRVDKSLNVRSKKSYCSAKKSLTRMPKKLNGKRKYP